MRSAFALLPLPLLALAACERPADDPRALPPLVAVTTVAPGGGDAQRFTGTIRARIESDLGFRVGGKIARRLVDAGQTVRRGQPLFQLDPADLALAASGQDAAVMAARAVSAQAAADFKRLDGLVEAGAVSAQAFEQARERAATARAQLEAAEAQARVSRNARSYALLLADSDGIVAETSAEPGQVVAAGQPVVRLAHAGPREAVVDLPETVRPALGSPALAQLFGTGAGAVPARLRQLSQSADPATRTYQARYVLAGAATAPLGATVTVTLRSGTAATAPIELPLGAIHDPGSGPGVWTVAGGRVHFRPVRLTGLSAETARVAGLTPGQTIVALGADRLREGQAVRMMAFGGTKTGLAAQ